MNEYVNRGFKEGLICIQRWEAHQKFTGISTGTNEWYLHATCGRGAWGGRWFHARTASRRANHDRAATPTVTESPAAVNISFSVNQTIGLRLTFSAPLIQWWNVEPVRFKQVTVNNRPNRISIQVITWPVCHVALPSSWCKFALWCGWHLEISVAGAVPDTPSGPRHNNIR